MITIKNILVLLIFINMYQSLAQKKEILKLEEQKKEIQNNINSLKDSVVSIENKIEKLKSKEFNKVVSDTAMAKVKIRSGSSLFEKPTAYSEKIIEFNKDMQVSVFDLENKYFKVCAGSYCGYVHSVWVESNPEIDRFVRRKKSENENEFLKKKKSELSAREFQILKKYGKETYNRLKKGTYWIGMTTEMAEISLGKPSDINKTVGSWGVNQQWVYDNIYLYFENGKLTSYQN